MSSVLSILLPSSRVPEPLRQSIYITNILTSIFSILTFFLFFILFLFFGWASTSGYILFVAAVFIVIVFINRKYYNVGRLLFCLVPVYLTLVITLYGKATGPSQSYITFFDSRFIILVTTILPGVSFRLNEKLKIWICLASTFLCLVLFDPIHNALGLGYFQSGYNALSYYYINYVTLICYFALLFGVIALKGISEKAEQKAQESLDGLNEVNDQLVFKNSELIRLNHAMEVRTSMALQQQEEIKASRELVKDANRLISEQQEKLVKANEKLEERVKETNANLIRTNDELVRHNNELRQFSYTVSHNLRGPVARLLGLTDLFSKPISEDEREVISQMISKSGYELDDVLKDLSLIIDIRNDLYQVREKISFNEEWKKTLAVLGDQVHPSYAIEVDFENAPFVFSLRAMIQSILFNLLSNAIKYRNPENNLKISVKTFNSDNNTVLRVSDNGLGINLESQRENLFRLYRRFHMHVDGKGLGLYLVKTQVDTLGGKIEIESEINRGTTFIITLPTPQDVSKQVFYESEAAKIYYDASHNNTVIIWKRNISGIEYRRAFQAVLHTLKTYHTPGWIADLRLQGEVQAEEQIWFLNTVIPEAVRCGLKRIAAVGFNDPVRRDYYDRMILRTKEQGINLEVFESLEEAMDWMEEFMLSVKSVTEAK